MLVGDDVDPLPVVGIVCFFEALALDFPLGDSGGDLGEPVGEVGDPVGMGEFLGDPAGIGDIWGDPEGETGPGDVFIGDFGGLLFGEPGGDCLTAGEGPLGGLGGGGGTSSFFSCFSPPECLPTISLRAIVSSSTYSSIVGPKYSSSIITIFSSLVTINFHNPAAFPRGFAAAEYSSSRSESAAFSMAMGIGAGL